MIGRRRLLQGTGLLLAFSPRTALADLLRHEREPQNLATPTSLFDRLITPTADFFVRSHFGPPALDRNRPLTVDGLTNKLTLTAAELEKSFKPVTVTAVLQCSGNGRALHAPRVPGIQWIHGAMGQATFTGVRLRDLLEKAGLGPEQRTDGHHVHLLGADAPPKPQTPAFLRSIPMARALDPSTLVAYRMNGEELTLAHGAPLRLVVPGWAGDHWVKWLTKISVEKEEAKGFFMQTAYRMPTEKVEPGSAVPPEKMRPATTFPVKSIIGAPANGARTAPGKQKIVGVAFSGEAPIAKVEVSIDDGKTWRTAKLDGEPGVGRWVVFTLELERKEPGRVRAIARATDKKGNVQPEHAVWNGWHSVSWEIA